MLDVEVVELEVVDVDTEARVDVVVSEPGLGSVVADGLDVEKLGSPSSSAVPLHAATATAAMARRTKNPPGRRVRFVGMEESTPALPGGLSLSELAKAYLVRGLIAGAVVGFMLGLLNALSAGATTEASLLSLIGRFFWSLLWSVIGGSLGGITLTAVLNGLRRAVSSDRWNSTLVRSMGAVSGVLMGLIFARSLFLAAVAGLAGYLWAWPVPGSVEALEAGI